MELKIQSGPYYLGKDEVSRHLTDKWEELIAAIENALASYSSAAVIQPVRSTVSVAPHSGNLLTMSAYSPTDDVLGAKLVTVYPQNKSQDLPSIQAVVLFFNACTGTLRAIMDGQIITNMRTAASSAVATKYLAKPDSKILAILGAGEQARSHYKVLKYLYELEKINVWNVNKESAEKLVTEIQDTGIVAECHNTIQEAVMNADIIVTVTMAKKPILMKEWVKPGVHINAVGAPFPTWQELSADLMLSSVVYVDSRAGAQEESGDIIKSKAEIYAEIGEVILGTKEAFHNKTTVFKSLGMAVEDVVAAKLVLDIYEKTLPTRA